ncbi:MAG: UDP-glucose--hexose-1-phosphate uridylyltransferase [Bacteroidota bacterium]
MISPELFANPHRRRNALTGEWVLVSPQRTLRPWQGAVEKTAPATLLPYDPACYLCPGNARAGNERNPPYTDTFVFTNDFAALIPSKPGGDTGEERLLTARRESGICRVVCFSPRHDLALPRLGPPAVERVVETWVEEYSRLRDQPGIGYVQIFENKGSMMGASNPHPHCQIWAQSTVPGIPAAEGVRQREHFQRTGRTLLSDYLELEEKEGERIVCRNDQFVALVPFWAVWPFEILVVARRPVPDLLHFTSSERTGFADILRQVTIRYDNLFESPFPYSAGMHQSPTDGVPHEEWHFHMHFLPPLLRSATVRKFMVGYELLAEPQRDITPELSAERLRAVPKTHYLDAGTSTQKRRTP